MTHRPDTALDSFEAALLVELKAALPRAAESAHLLRTLPRTLPRTRSRLPRRRWQLTAGAAVAGALAVTLLPGLGPTPAYAVTGRNGGEIHVKVNRLEGADGLERALADRGVAADITYLPDGTECAAGRYAEVDAPGLTLSVGAKSFEVTIPAGTVGDGDTFVLDASVVPLPTGLRARVRFGIGQGPIAPCRIIDSP